MTPARIPSYFPTREQELRAKRETYGGLSEVSSRRAREARVYTKAKAAWLKAHPFCQVYLFRHRIPESVAIFSGGVCSKGPLEYYIPRATTIHHRNKRAGERLTDTRWFMSASLEQHNWVEGHKDEARELGLLLPMNANRDGKWGDDQQGLTTDELMKSAISK